MAEWRVVRDGNTIEPDLYDAEVVDTANPFGNYAIAYIDDVDGEKFDDYTRGTRVDFQVEEFGVSTVGYGESYGTSYGTGTETRFTGFVVEARELDREGRDSLEVECYSFDQFLRRTTVTNDQTGNTISQALEDIITTDTPVDWVAGNVDVADNQTLTRSYRGERVENVLHSLVSTSGNEEFGVNSALEFFFRPLESSHAPRDIDNTQWLDYDLPEEGKAAVNEVTVFYDGGDKSVTVDDGSDKLELQDNLGTRTPVSLSEEVTREDITNIDDARAVGEQILNGRESTLTGTVTTYGLLDANPGDVISIQIDPRGIDGDFRIAEIEYRWSSDEAILTIIEKRGDQDDLLVGLSESVKRVEMRQANRDAVGNRITSTAVGAVITGSGDVDGTSFDAAQVTNITRNKLRDGWAGGGNISITQIAVGNDSSAPSRTDTALGNELERVSVTETLSTSTSVEYSGTVSTTDIREVGLFDADGDLIVRATIPDTSLTSTVDVTATLTVSNDAAVENGVLTTAGQTSVRDILADNTPDLPTKYAYGTSGATPAESDASLGNQAVVESLEELLIQTADGADGWNDTVSVSDTDPFEVTGVGALDSFQTCFTVEGEDYDSADGSPGFDTNGDYSDGTAALLQANGDRAVYNFTPSYTIPSAQVNWYVRAVNVSGEDSPETEFAINGNEVDTLSKGTGLGTLGWNQPGEGQFGGGDGYTGDDLAAGEVHTATIEVLDADVDDSIIVDVSAVFDDRYTYTFDNDNGGSDGYLDGPELYPDLIEVDFETAATRRTLENATAEQSWDDTSNNQYIALSNDGSTYIQTNNAETATAAFASAETGVDTRIGISRYGSRTTATPQTGFNGQAVDAHDLFADVDAITSSDVGVAEIRSIVSPNTITGTTLREAGQLDANDNLLTHCVFADFDVLADQRVISSESVTWRNP